MSFPGKTSNTRGNGQKLAYSQVVTEVIHERCEYDDGVVDAARCTEEPNGLVHIFGYLLLFLYLRHAMSYMLE